MPSEPMNIQEQGFRSSLFGFDKNDVLAYMNALANEAQQHELEYNRQLQQLHQLGLLDVLSQTDAAYILPDADAVLLDFLFHGLTSHKIMVRGTLIFAAQFAGRYRWAEYPAPVRF